MLPRFNPEPSDDKTLTWESGRFVKDRVTSFLHIPLNFGAVMKRNISGVCFANRIRTVVLACSRKERADHVQDN